MDDVGDGYRRREQTNIESAGEARKTREGKTTRGGAGDWRYETSRGYVYMRRNAARRTYQQASMRKLTGD